MKYDYVKGYKSPINSLPKEIKEIVLEKLKNDSTVNNDEIDTMMYEVDVYYSVDIKNSYKRRV